MRRRLLPLVTAVCLALLTAGQHARAQTTATLTGRVTDSQRASLDGADVRLTRTASGVDHVVHTADAGTFRLTNIPPQTYLLTVSYPGFEPHVQTIDLRTNVPVELDVTLALAAQQLAVDVSARGDGPVVDATSSGTRAALSESLIDQLPMSTGSRGLEAVLVTLPGFAPNANGAIHPRGAHNQMTYVVDGLPISDQLTGAFANAIDTGIVEHVEMMTGNIPAEFGAKVSGVAIVTTRSGLGSQTASTGEASVRVGQFDSQQVSARAAGERGRLGYFGALNTMRTDRFLDQVSLDNLHNAGTTARAFGRVDVSTTGGSLLRLYGMGGQSAFELANLRSQQARGQDQRQRLHDWSAWTSYLATLGAASTLESTAAFRSSRAQLLPSAGDTPVTASQHRTLSTLTLATRLTHVAGAHSVRVGADLQRFPVREQFTLGLTAPAFNSPDAPSFNPALLPYDLTRGGTRFRFDERAAGSLASAFAQDSVRWSSVTATLGLRFDDYRFLVRGRQLQPRVGVAWLLPDGRTTLRASYNRNYQTPPNENLLISSSANASRLAPPAVRDALGAGYRPIQPERQDVAEVGAQHVFGDGITVDVAAYRKRSRDAQDNNNFLDTGVIFPTTLAALRAHGLEARLTVPARRGESGTLSVTSARAVATPPFTGGLFLGQDAVDLLSAGPFVIDHDQRLSAHATLHADMPLGMWTSGSIRYDSGLVSNPSSPGEVAASPDYADLLPYVNLTADVPRVRPRTIVDLAVGYDRRVRGTRGWGLRAQVTNLFDKTALYNFQSVFVGTRLVAPRTVSAELRYRW